MLESKVSTELPLASQGPNPDPGRGLLVRCFMQVVWPAFMGAAITVGLLFSVIDPIQIEWVNVHLEDSRPAAYTLAFLVFWVLFSLTCSMTWYLAITETPKGKNWTGATGLGASTQRNAMTYFQIAGVLILLPFVVDAIRRSELDRASRDELFIWMGLTALVFAILLLTRGLPEGITLKYSGAAFLALTLGYSRALLSMTLLLLITQPWMSMGFTLLVDGLLPIWLMLSVVRFSRRFLPANPFVFLLGCGFFGLFLVYAVQQCVGVISWALLTGIPVGAELFSEQTGLRLLLAGGEATLEGMIITILVVYCPRAVLLFDDEFYLSRPM